MVFGGVEIAFLNLLRDGGAAHIVANSSLNPEKLSSSSNRNLPTLAQNGFETRNHFEWLSSPDPLKAPPIDKNTPPENQNIILINARKNTLNEHLLGNFFELIDAYETSFDLGSKNSDIQESEPEHIICNEPISSLINTLLVNRSPLTSNLERSLEAENKLGEYLNEINEVDLGSMNNLEPNKLLKLQAALAKKVADLIDFMAGNINDLGLSLDPNSDLLVGHRETLYNALKITTEERSQLAAMIPDQKHQDEILLFTGLQKLQNQARTVKEKIEETLENSH